MVQRRLALTCHGLLHASRPGHLRREWPLRWPPARPPHVAGASQKLYLLQNWRTSSGSSGADGSNADSAPSASGSRASAKAASATSQEDGVAEDGEIPPEVMDLFDTLRGEALRRLDEFGPIHLFSLCWAYSTARLLDDDLQKQVTDAALRLGRSRDENPQSGTRKVSAAAPKAKPPPPPSPVEPAQDERAEGDSNVQATREGREAPSILAQTSHWMALYKPPYWLVSVDSKEAAKAAASTPFEDEDEGDADDELAFEGSRKRPRVHMWIRQNLAHQYPVCTDPIEAHGLLHRLDAQTSGILLCAKTYVGAYWLRLQWCSYTVDKEYVCLVHGWVDKSVREIHKRIRIDKKKAENSRRTISTHCSISPSGKPSYTELYTLAHLVRPAQAREPEQAGEEAHSSSLGDEDEQRFSLVALKLHTGRTHQIRVHMLSIGHPLVCDSKYAEERLTSDRIWCPRNFLHTYRLGFEDVPSSGEEQVGQDESQADKKAVVDVLCPIPQDLRIVLEGLQPVDDVSALRREEWLSGDSTKLRSFEEYASADVVANEVGTAT